MKKIARVALLLATLPSWSCTSPSARTPAALATVPAKGTVVLELFTSQGCSSCPPADRLLGTYTAQPHIIPLSFHVDYWDRTGWKDPFSAHQFSERQYRYAALLKSQIYTPQLVINGDTQLVGSETGAIQTTIRSRLSQQPRARLSIDTALVSNGVLDLKYHVTGDLSTTGVNIALVEKNTITDIGDGENRGATLHECNVVRDFEPMDSVTAGENERTLKVPASLQPGNRQVIVYLQQAGNRSVTAADRADF